MMHDCGPEPETKENGMTQVTGWGWGWGRPATSSPAASGVVLSPSHPWRKDDPGGGFPSLKQTLDPSVTCVLTQRGGSIQFTSELLGKIHECQAVPFCMVKKRSLKKQRRGFSQPRFGPSPCAAVSCCALRSFSRSILDILPEVCAP